MTELTPTEKIVLKLAITGMRGKEIAEALGVSVKTTQKHTATINFKFGTDSRLSMLRVAIRSGLVTVEEFLSHDYGEGIEHRQIPTNCIRVKTKT